MVAETLTDWDFWKVVLEGLALMAGGASMMWAYLRRRRVEVHENIESGDTKILESLEGFRGANQKKFKRVYDRMDKQDSDMNALGNRMTKVEQEVQNLPSHQDIKDINRALAKVSGQVAEANARSEDTHRLVMTINEYLIQRDEK